MKYYHVLIARPEAEARGDTSTRRCWTTRKQSSAPAGWVCLGNLGYFEKPGRGDRDHDDDDGRRDA